MWFKLKFFCSFDVSFLYNFFSITDSVAMSLSELLEIV